MDMKVDASVAAPVRREGTVFAVLAAISVSHLLNDLIQSLLPAIYPILKESFHLDFGQVGLITLAFQLTASLLQPLIGLYTDRRPSPWSLVVGMGFTLVGLVLLSVAPNYPVLLLAAALVGVGSSVFHPEASRVARLASGGRHGFAQSVFQVGGYAGTALGPLLAAFIVVPRGQSSVAWFTLAALLAIVILFNVGGWYQRRVAALRAKARPAGVASALSRRRVALAIGVLAMLIFSKQVYMVSLSNYFTFYLMGTFGLSVQAAQIHLFLFLGAVAAGTVFGGLVGDRIGRKYVIWGSILGVLPFTLALPYADLFWTGVLSVVIGLLLSSAFPAIVVYGQELVPGRVGLIAGLFFGLMFGLSGLAAAALGELADRTSLAFVYHLCSFLPAIGLLAAFLPNTERADGKARS
jgi:MFS transporter, FSR family, fosmidomycin resistance protein